MTLSTSGTPPISLNWKEVPLVTSTVETKMGSTNMSDVGLNKHLARSSNRPKRPPVTRNEDFFMDSVPIKTSVVACSVNGDICISCGQSCVCNQNLWHLISCTVQQSKLVTDKDDKCIAMKRNQATRKHSPKNTMEDHFYDNPSCTRLLPHKHPINP